MCTQGPKCGSQLRFVERRCKEATIQIRLFLRLVVVSRGRLRHRLQHGADRIRFESRRRILPERVVRLRAQGHMEGLLHVVVLGDGHRLLVRRHLQFAGRDACLALGGADLGTRRHTDQGGGKRRVSISSSANFILT